MSSERKGEISRDGSKILMQFHVPRSTECERNSPMDKFERET
jgi:hypothetical protein